MHWWHGDGYMGWMGPWWIVGAALIALVVWALLRSSPGPMNGSKEMEASLRQKYPTAEARLLLEPFQALAHDAEFWNHTLDGLAVLGGPGIFRALRIPQPVAELVVVADSFHTKPLRRFLQSVDRYQVLGLSLDKIRLFEGNRHALDEFDLVTGVPPTIADALGGELTEPHQTVASYGGVGGALTALETDAGRSIEKTNAALGVTKTFLPATERRSR